MLLPLPILIVGVVIVLLIKENKKNKALNNKVKEFNPISKGQKVFHLSGLPIANHVELNLYNCSDKLLFANNDYTFTIAKEKISKADLALVKSFFQVLTIYYQSDNEDKKIEIRGMGSDLECSKKNETIEL